MRKIGILGVKICAMGFVETLSTVEKFLRDKRKHFIVTPYAESLVAAQKDLEFRKILNKADLAIPDGSSLLAAAKYDSVISHRLSVVGCRWLRPFYLLGMLFEGLKVGWALLFNRKYLDVIKEPVRGVDLMEALCKEAAEKGWKVFLLGGWSGVGEKAAAVLRKRYPKLKVWALAGVEGVQRETKREREETLRKINALSPDLLFVAYGPVWQEKWLARNWGQLKVRVAMGVGGAFDLMAVAKPRSPLFLRNLGLEWFWRLLAEPRRIKRILTAVVVFPLLVFLKSFRQLNRQEANEV